MQNLTFKVDDKAWLYLGGHQGEMTEGTVAMVLNVPGYTFEHYLIEIETGVDPVLEVRHGLSLSDDANKPIGLYRS